MGQRRRIRCEPWSYPRSFATGLPSTSSVAPIPISDALVFTAPKGGRLRRKEFGAGYWKPALGEAGIEHLRVHDLRHTCASLLIATGANPKAVQAQLGHSSIQVTFDRYGHLFPSDQEALAARMDEVYLGSLTDTRRTPDGHKVVKLPNRRALVE